MLAAVARGVREAWAALPQPEEDEVEIGFKAMLSHKEPHDG